VKNVTFQRDLSNFQKRAQPKGRKKEEGNAKKNQLVKKQGKSLALLGSFAYSTG
jgi:hypothetical protein